MARNLRDLSRHRLNITISRALKESVDSYTYDASFEVVNLVIEYLVMLMQGHF